MDVRELCKVTKSILVGWMWIRYNIMVCVCTYVMVQVYASCGN